MPTVEEKKARFISELELAAKSTRAVDVATAFRAATAILTDMKMSWTDFVNSRGSAAGGGGRQNGAAGAESPEEVRRLLEKAMRGTDPASSFYGFLQSLSDQFEEKGYLSDRQMSALRRSAERA